MTSSFSRRAWLVAGDLPQPLDGGVAPVFVSRVVLCDVRFAVARVRLATLIGAGWLTLVSGAAWAGGLTALSGFWGRRDDPPVPVLARVSLLEPAAGTDIVTLPLHWEIVGPVRVLNAGLTLMPAGQDQTVLRLDGMVRLPHAAAGYQRAGVRAHRAAAACAEFLLAGVADALAGPAPTSRYGTRQDPGHDVAVPRPRRRPGGNQESPPYGSAGMP